MMSGEQDDEEEGSQMVGGYNYSTFGDQIKECRGKIALMSEWLRKIAIIMEVYSIIFMLLKSIDFSNLN